jgi:tricorn protease
MRIIKNVSVLIAFVMLSSLILFASDEAKLMRYPDIYKDKVVYSYAGDIWISPLDGGYARRLTTSPGVEYFPKFSPDGKWIAFTGQYDGYFQVFVIPSEGGDPRQLTFYPYDTISDRGGFPNQVMEWTPDGKYIVFRSMQYFWNSSYGRYCKISPDGGWPEPMPFFEGSTMSFSPDGKKIAMNRSYRDFRTWKRYRGGRERNIWIYDFDKDSITEVLGGEFEEANPIWHKDTIYFLSDKTGTFNLYKYDIDSKEIKQITDNKDWDIQWPGNDDESIVFQSQGKLFRMAFSDEKITPLDIKIGFDKSSLTTFYKDVSRNIESFDLASGGKRAAFIARGELFTVPAEKGDIRNISNTPAARETSASWSPDVKWICFISDKSGNEEIYITDQLGKKEIQLTYSSKALIQAPGWAPDSRKIAYWDTDKKFYYVDIRSKKITLIDTTERNVILDYEWSPDSKWIAYTKQEDNDFPSIYLYNLQTKKISRITDGMTQDYAPQFDPEGKYLYFISSRDFNPTTLTNFELSFTYNRMDRIYLMTLKKDIPNPFKIESDEVDPAKIDEANKDDDDREAENRIKKEIKKPVTVEIDLDGISDRIAAMPVAPGDIRRYTVVKNGIIYLVRRDDSANRRSATLYGYDLEKKKEVEMLADVFNFTVTADGKKILYYSGNADGIAKVKFDKIDRSKGVLNLRGMMSLVDPLVEWKEMFLQAWRLEKNLFYVANMHGVDWEKILQKYLPLVDYLTHRRDLTYLIGEMIGELCIGHTYTGGGEMPEVENTSVGLLGAEFEPDQSGYFKITKIYSGENWINQTRSPLTDPGIKASVGDYILEINGKQAKLPDNPYILLKKTIGTIVSLKLNNKPDPKGAWEIKINPIASETQLKYLDWVETNRKFVEKATNGKVGYVHIPDMSFNGLNQFVKTWYSQLTKEGIIIDERFNGGGFVSQMILERLRRFLVGLSFTRNFGVTPEPPASFSGKLVMLINSYAGSDGDIFPYHFRAYKLGTIIGTRTWGGVVGIAGFTPLMDGGYVTIPISGTYGLDGNWAIENEGVSADIELDNMPNDVAKGKDAQLEKAIEVILQKIAEKPFVIPPVPADPVR